MIRYVVVNKKGEKLRQKEVGMMPLPRTSDYVYLYETGADEPKPYVVMTIDHYPQAGYIVIKVIER